MTDGITLTENAVHYIKQSLQLPADKAGIRLKLKTTGCSGFSYALEPLQAVIPHSDMVFHISGLQIVIDKESLRYVNGTEIDYVQDELNENLIFKNPNAEEECGCGESFTVKKDQESTQ